VSKLKLGLVEGTYGRRERGASVRKEERQDVC
jgi:hypothetical protein